MEENKGFLDDQNRWDQFLYHMNILSLNKWSGFIALTMNEGRVSRNTLKEVNDVTRPFIEAAKQGGINA